MWIPARAVKRFNLEGTQPIRFCLAESSIKPTIVLPLGQNAPQGAAVAKCRKLLLYRSRSKVRQFHAKNAKKKTTLEDFLNSYGASLLPNIVLVELPLILLS